MLNEHDALELVYACLSEIDRLRPEQARLTISHGAKILGPPGQLDSLEIVDLTISLERKLSGRLGSDILLVDDHFLSYQPTPLNDAASLARYLTERFGAPEALTAGQPGR